MRTPVALALLAILAFAPTPAASLERECRPSLSNWYHCPDTAAQPKTARKTTSAKRECVPSLSNGFNCPGTTAPPKRTASVPDRECRPSLSNGFNCPGQGQTATKGQRDCVPSLSNGFNCSGPATGQLGANQYSTEGVAWAHCPTDTVVWANNESRIYHFRNAYYYGKTKAGGYMCERDARASGLRAAKNEKRPS